MIKAVVNKRVTLTADVGSVVYISEGQFAALQGKVESYKEEAKAVEEVIEESKKEVIEESKQEVIEKPKQESKKPTSKKTSSKGKKG